MRKRLLAVAGAVAVAAVPALASPAAAAPPRCVAIADWKWIGDARVVGEVCVQKDVPTGKYRSTVSVGWVKTGPTQFRNFDVHLRLEKYDVAVKGKVCDFTSRINSSDNQMVDCQIAWMSAQPPLTGDATIVYDRGSGSQSWDLTGSPVISY
ncbi:hypothetical protein ACWF94_02415 [Streptomyces sp. NPDC055078]